MIEFKTKNPIIYISGQISGLDIEDAKRYFSATKRTLERELINQSFPFGESEKQIESFKIINPFDCHSVNVETKTWDEYMLEDIKYLFRCNTIYMLRNWKNSKGAKVEKAIAEALEFQVIFE